MTASDRRKEIIWDTYAAPPVQPFSFGTDHPGCSVLRLDMIRSWASGNKYFKLKDALSSALSQGATTIVSKGGMFSNHLAALSEACSVFDLHLVAVIRSYAPDEQNPAIRRLRANGNEIIYLSPSAYKNFDMHASANLYPEAFFIPEGGLSDLGIKGTSGIAASCMEVDPTHIILPGGTMGTACGLLSVLPAHVRVIIVPAWKGCSPTYIQEVLDRFLINPSCSWELWPDFHFGGFGKFDQSLIDFMYAFTSFTGIPLDPVYTGKMVYALSRRIEEGYFTSADHVLAIHTGGLQGVEGYQYRFPEAWGAYLRE